MSSALMCFLQCRHPVDGTPQMCMSIDYDVQKSRLAGEESRRQRESIFRCLHAQSGAGSGKPFKTKAPAPVKEAGALPALRHLKKAAQRRGVRAGSGALLAHQLFE